MAPIVEPNSPAAVKSLMVRCVRATPMKPPISEPTSPSTIVPSTPMGSRPGTMSRARAPATSPMMSHAMSAMSEVFPASGGANLSAGWWR